MKQYKKNGGLTFKKRNNHLGFQTGAADTFKYFTSTMDVMDNLRVPRR